MAHSEKERNIKTKMRQYAADCRKIAADMEESGRKEDRIKALLQVNTQPRTRGTRWNFMLEQIGYLGRYCLVWQALWAGLFMYVMCHGIPYLEGRESENQVLVLISLLPPLLVLLTVEEITRVYQRSLLEIEYTTKYSLQSVVLLRMLVLSMFHFMILTAVIVIAHMEVHSDIGTLLVYGATPMILMTGILMKCMQCCRGEQLRSAGAGVYALTVILASVGGTRYCGWYQPVYFVVWCVLCAAGILFVIWQFCCLYRKFVSFEQLARNC